MSVTQQATSFDVCLEKVFGNFNGNGILSFFLELPGEIAAKTTMVLSSKFALHWCLVFALGYVTLVFIMTRVFHLRTSEAKTGTPHASIVSYEMMGGLVCTYMSLAGFAIWFGYLGNADEMARNAIDPFSVNTALITHIATPMLIFQVWNSIISLTIKEYCTVDSFIHHFAVIWVVLLTLDPLWHGYAVFYLGICEFSSIFFAVCQVFRYVEPWAKAYPEANKISRILFPIVFFVIRLGLFMSMNIYFYIDTYNIVCVDSSVTVKSYANVFGFLLINVILSTLQIIWSKKLFKLVMKTLADPDHKTDHETSTITKKKDN